MSSPQQPKHGPAFDPSKGNDAPPDPKATQDLPYPVPNLGLTYPYVAPSFNLDPPNSSGSGNAAPAPPCAPFDVNLVALRWDVASLFGAMVGLVDDYQTLRDKVMAAKDTVFGQNARVPDNVYGVEYYQPSENGQPSPIQDNAKQFAATMNPAQDKALAQMAAAMEVVGQYIAAVNRAGQAYSSADRKAEFPAPPPNPVTF
jgi:hypothetical protein